MALTVYPTVVFNAATGSDSAASGAGPATAVTGTAKASTASTTVEFNETVDLSGVNQDGSHVLWVNGIGFVRISTVDDPNNTLVVETALTIGAGTAIAIGGKRATLDETESRRIFAATSTPTASGATAQWTIQLEDDQSLTSVITPTFTAGTGYLNLEGNSTTTRRTITQTANAYHFTDTTTHNLRLRNLIFRNSNATKNEVVNINGNARYSFKNCIVGAADGTNCPKGISKGAFNGVVLFYDSASLCTTSTAMQYHAATLISHSLIYKSGATAILGSANTIRNSIISYTVTGDGVNTNTSSYFFNCTFHGNAGDAIEMTQNGVIDSTRVTECIFTNNGGYGIKCSGTAPHDPLVAYCSFGSGANANTGGNASGFTLDATNTTTFVPGWANSADAAENLRLTATYKGAGVVIGAGQSGTTNYLDAGAAQRMEPVMPALSSILSSETAIGELGAEAGTFDESARNTDPGESNVLTGTSYKIHNVDKNGSASAGGSEVDGPGITTANYVGDYAAGSVVHIPWSTKAS